MSRVISARVRPMTDSDRHSPRAASVLCAHALSRIDLVQPPTLRDPVRHLLTATIELCATKRSSLLGYPVTSALEIARGLLDAAAASDGEPAPATTS